MPSRIGFLGPFTVDDRDGTKFVTAPKLRMLLVALAEHAGTVVGRRELVDAVWETPPENPGQTLRTYIARLRELGFGIQTEEGGYRLLVSPDDVDSKDFEHLLDEARSLASRSEWEKASHKASEALSLWPEPAPAPLAGLSDFPLKERLSGRLTEKWKLAKKHKIDADIHLGRPRGVLPDLKELTARFPLDEEFHMLHLRALCRSGRRAEAIQAYHDTCEFLSETHGTDPSPALRALYERIIAEPPDPDI